MPNTTVFENLTYSCLTDPFQRHWIQDLAEDADNSLARIQSDLAIADNRPRAQMRRTTGQQAVPNNTDVQVSFTQYDYGPSNWNNLAGTITPTEPGLYYVELTVVPATTGSTTGFEAFAMQLQYNGVALIRRKWPSDTSGTFEQPRKASGLIYVNAVPAVLRGIFSVTTTAAVTVNIVSARLACTRWIGCATTALNTNPTFENGLITPWAADQSVLSAVRTPANPAHGGVWSSRVDPLTPASTTPAMTSDQFPATAGDVYTIKAWIYPTVAEQYLVGVRWFNAISGGAQIGTNSGAATLLPAGQWTQVAMTATAPVGTLGARMRVERASVTTPAPAYFVDDAMAAHLC